MSICISIFAVLWKATRGPYPSHYVHVFYTHVIMNTVAPTEATSANYRLFLKVQALFTAYK